MRRSLLQNSPQVFHEVLTIFPFYKLMIPDAFNQDSSFSQERVTFVIVCLLVWKAVP